MGNLSTKGIIIDSLDLPMQSVTVTVFDADVWPFRDRLGSAVTGPDGSFNIAYSPGTYGPLETKPDIYIEVSFSGSVIFVSQILYDVASTIHDLGRIKVTGTNIKLTGRVTDLHRNPIAGLIVTASDIDTISKDDFLGSTITDTLGSYSLTYPSTTYSEITDPDPDIVVTVMDSLGLRVLAKTSEFSNIKQSTFLVPDILISQQNAIGWAATLNNASPSQLSIGNRIEFLIDNQETFTKLIEAIDNAKFSISLLELSFDPKLIATFTGSIRPDISTLPNRNLAEALISADNRGVKVRIMVSIFLTENPITHSYKDLKDFFSIRQPNNIKVRSINLNQPVHAKTVIIDEENSLDAQTFILGSPLEQGYWDTALHIHDDIRRGAGAAGIKRPIHDVSLNLKGPVIADVATLFRQLWNFLSTSEHNGNDIMIPPVHIPVSMANQSIQIVRSLPRSTVFPSGEAGILEAYFRALTNAEDYLYIENQYFSSRVFTDALFRIVKAKPNLQVIIIINEHPDIPTYRYWQDKRIMNLDPLNSQIGIFSLWNTGFARGKVSVRNYYTHSKVAIADDTWATVGTANMDGISLQSSEELSGATTALGAGVGLAVGTFLFGALVPAVELSIAFGSLLGAKGGDRRNVEINAVILDGIDGHPETGKVKALKNGLWTEHLGQVPLTRPQNGWLSHWREVSARNIDLLSGKNGVTPTMEGRILPYRPEKTAREQLAAMGINTSNLTVLD